MSFSAIAWAISQEISNSSAKFDLVVLANYANNDTWFAHPSLAQLVVDTAQNRKTVIRGLQWLLREGYITDTGERKGATRQVIVYRLNDPKNGTLKENQKGNSSESGTVPDLPANSTVFNHKESQIYPETVPKTVHGTYQEPVKEPVNEPVSKGRGPTTGTISKGARISNDFTPSTTDLAWAAHEYPALDLKAVTAEFIDYWLGVAGSKGVKLDWSATWRNSVRRAGQFRSRSTGSTNRPQIAQQFGSKTYTGTPDDELPAYLRTDAA